MYTGTADHALTAELVELVDVPVVASGDVTSRARAQAVLATTGARAVMVGRARRATRGRSREIVDGDDGTSRRARRSSRSWSSSSRETVRELGERRARRLPEEVLRLVPRPRALPEAVQAGARAARVDGRGRRTRCSPPRPARPTCSSGSRASCPPLDGRPARAADLDLRRRLAAASQSRVPLPDEPEALERQERVDAARSCASAARSARRGRRSRSTGASTPSSPRIASTIPSTWPAKP